jgi:heme-degrading monooxygenase HmoA
MFVVIFEVQPKTEQFEEYLALAKLLRPELEKVEGFIDNERYRNTAHPERILSLSTWRDEKALIRWRTFALHHEIQEKGRGLVFFNYRLRVGEVYSDTLEQTLAQHRFDETEAGNTKVVTITELTFPADKPDISAVAQTYLPDQGTPNLVESELFQSIYNPTKRLILTGWQAKPANPTTVTSKLEQGISLRQRQVRVIRAYGMFNRLEAPQYYPEVAPPPDVLSW